MRHPAWKARLIICLLMLVLGLVGMFFTSFQKTGAWQYWRFIVLLYAALGLTLTIHLKKMGWKTTVTTLWQECLHWLGLLGAIWIVSYFVGIGVQGKFEASLQMMTILALATYLAGIYIEVSFLPLGILLGLCAAGKAFLSMHLFLILIPVGVGIFALIIHFTHKKHKEDAHHH